MPDKMPQDVVCSVLGLVLDREVARQRYEEVLRTIGPLPPMLRPSRVALILDAPRQRVYELISMGALDHVKLGPRAIRVPRVALERFLARGCGVDQDAVGGAGSSQTSGK